MAMRWLTGNSTPETDQQAEPADLGSQAAPWVRFSQSEDLTVRLQNILHDYAFGPGVFRELLQNADDAGAHRFCLLLDGTSFSTEDGLLDSRLGQWQGPAVCAFNDAEFSDADFDGICRVGASAKRSDHAKIGRYGLGFNATYHLSDVVSFVSRDRLCIFDPHEAHLPSDLPGLQLKLGPAELQRYHAQLAPFESAAAAFGAEVWPLKGAIFRLPFRTPELARRSKICRESHDFDEVLGVFMELLRGAAELLLFLQSVECVEVLVREPGARHRRLGSVSLRAAGEAALQQLRLERRLLTGTAASQAAEKRRNGSAKPPIRRSGYAFVLDASWATGTGAGASHCEETSVWLIVARAEPASAEASSTESSTELDDSLPAQHCGAVAVRLWLSASHGVEGASMSTAQRTAIEGQAFCFLPLALTTGLPVHVSANFALTANRRDLWRKSDDKASSHSMCRAAWNETLLSGTLPRVYADLLQVLSAGLEPFGQHGIEAGCSKAKNFAPPEADWHDALGRPCIAETLWAAWPTTALGAFQELPERLAAELFSRNAEVLWDDGRCCYSSAKVALLCSAEEYARLDPGLRSALGQLCLAGSRRSVVQVPQGHCEALSEIKGAVWLRPQALASAFRGASPKLSANEADAVVAYLLAGGGGPLTVLHGLFLAPLAGGGYGCFEKPGTAGAEELWWSEDIELCELLPSRSFIDPTSKTFALLKPRVANAPLNIRLLNARALSFLLPAVVPPIWRGKRAVSLADGIVFIDGLCAKNLQDAEEAMARAARQQAVKAGNSAKGGRKSQAKTNMPVKGRQTGKKASRMQGRGNNLRSGAHLWDEDADPSGEWWSDDDDWREDEQETCNDTAVAVKKPAKGDASPDTAEALTEEACSCATPEELDDVVRRCTLLWRIIERASEKGVNPVQVVSAYPCVPVVQGPAIEGGRLRLLSVEEAVRRHALAMEDFTTNDYEVLAASGVPFVQPGKRLRGALGIEKASTLQALQAVFAERCSRTPVNEATSANPRLYLGLRACRLPLDEARSLRVMLRSMVRRNLVPKDSKALEALPIFETQGGRFAVPLTPSSHRVLTPNEDWDEALRPDFQDYLISWSDEAAELLSDLGRERGSTVGFLAEFAAPRVGLFDQSLTVAFLEAVAALGNAPWKKPGAPKELAAIAQACTDAPLVVGNSNDKAVRRWRCSELADPGDAWLGKINSSDAFLFPPEAYCKPLVLSVMRRAGLRSLSDDSVFLETARRAEASPHAVQSGGALLQHLRDNWESLKWPTKAYAALGKLRIFPILDAGALGGAYPPETTSQAEAPGRVAVALDGPCTVYEHADVVWTQLSLLDPEVFNGWPPALRRRFGALKDPPPLEAVVANLAEVAARWALESSAVAEEQCQRRQALVAKHLAALKKGMAKRSHSTQMMVQQRLSVVAFIVLDDGTLTKPPDVFLQLHSGGDSAAEDEDEEAESKPAKSKHDGAETRKASSPWMLPSYLRPFRRLLLSLAGPAISHGSQGRKVPTVHVSPAPSADTVPKFLQASLNDPVMADVEFLVRGEDGEEHLVYAHRLILAAACEHFHAVFTSGCTEASIGLGGRSRIELPFCVELRPVLWLLAYLYQGFDADKARMAAMQLESVMRSPGGSGSATSVGMVISGSAAGTAGGRRRHLPKLPRFLSSDDGEDLCALLRLSDLWDLCHLKQWTEQRLQALLNPENLVAISTHAFFCNASQLLSICVHHMQLLYAELVATPSWEELEPAIRDLVLLDCGSGSSQPKH